MAKHHYLFLGPALVLLFCASQAFRDVYFGHVFQGIDFFAVLLAFLASTVLFTTIPLLSYSTPSLIAILVYSAAAIMSNVAHVRDEPATSKPPVSAAQLPGPATI